MTPCDGGEAPRPTTDVGEKPQHSHQCDDCLAVWTHGDDISDLCATRSAFEKEHTCPECGYVQWIKYDPEESVTERRKHNDNAKALHNLARLMAKYEEELGELL